MNKKQSQSGFAHLVIIIVLIVVIIGLLGFVFWRNFIQPKASDMNSSATTSTSVEATTNAIVLSESVTDKYNSTGLTLKYPKSWTIEESSVGDSNNGGLATINITSPDGQVIVETEFSNRPQWGSGTGDGGRVIRIVETENITGMSGFKFVSYDLQSNADGQFIHVSGVYKNDVAATIVAGNEYGGMDFAALQAARFFEIGSKGDVARVNIMDNNSINGIYADNRYWTSNDIDDFINTENYKTAKFIAESLYTK